MRKTNNKTARNTTSKTAPALVEGSRAAMQEVQGKVLQFTTPGGLVVHVDTRGRDRRA